MKGVDTIPMMIQHIQECSRLYTAEYKVHKIITHSDTTKIESQHFSIAVPYTKRKVAIPIDATLKAYIDFGSFTADNIRRDGNKIVVQLPQPHVVMTSSSIDHDGIKQHVSLLRSDFSDEELSSYEQQGRSAIISDIPRLGILSTARRSAAAHIIPVIAMMGFKEEDITIVFVDSDKEKGGLTWVMD